MLVLNATFEPINVCTVRRATVLLLKERAELVERSERELHAESFTMPRPIVIRSQVSESDSTHCRSCASR